MISIKKPKTLPATLKNKGKEETESLCKEYSKNKADYVSKKKKFEFKKSIYGSKSVKNALIKAQNDKCFLCESRITGISYGDVEHFRPKGGSRQSEDDEMVFPGYYWLAYAWENLFLSCQICNQYFKKNLFPLADSDKKAKSHSDNLEDETPLFINPETENPEDYISFRGVIPFAVGGNSKGEATITNCGLRREILNESRLELYSVVKDLYHLANGMPETPFKVDAQIVLEKRLQQIKSSRHQFISMFRAAIKDKFKY